MLTSLWIAVPVAVVLGFLSGLGTGGGSLLILWLTMVLGMEQTIARSINLMFFIPSALVACFFQWKHGALDLKKLLPAVLSGCIGAFLFSRLSTELDLRILKKCYGALLIYTGIREFLYKSRKMDG